MCAHVHAVGVELMESCKQYWGHVKFGCATRSCQAIGPKVDKLVVISYGYSTVVSMNDAKTSITSV